MNCEQARQDLAAILYDECDPAARAALETHLASCAGCRKLQTEMQRAHEALSDWSVTVSPVRPDAEARPAPAPTRRWAPLGLGLAAGLALFATLFLAGTEVRVEDGRLHLILGRGAPTSPDAPRLIAETHGTLLEEAKSVAREEASGLTAEALSLFGRNLDRWAQLQDEQRRDFSRAWETRYREHLVRYSRLADSTLLRTAQEANRARRLAEEVVSLVSHPMQRIPESRESPR